MTDRSHILERRSLAVTLSPLMTAGQTSPREAFERLSRLGFGHVQLSAAHAGLRPRDLDKSARRDLLSLMRRHELSPSGLDVWIPTSHFADPSKVDRASAAVTSAIELAADLGRIPLSLLMPANAEPRGAIIQQAEHHGVPLADHTVPPAIEPGIAIGIDPAAWIAEQHDPVGAVPQHAANLFAARLDDLHRNGLRGPPGAANEGRLNVTRYKIALAVAAYRRPIIIDARQWTSGWTGIEAAADAWVSADVGFVR